MRFQRLSLVLSATLLPTSWAIELDLDSDASIKSVASTLAHGMMTYYTGNQSGQVPGLLPQPYYWWEAGAMFGSLIDYWYYTGDSTYNDITTQAMIFQTGPDRNYEPPNQTSDLGNDDQAFWAHSAMTAAEVKFPNPSPEQPQWLALAQAVFNRQAFRWDNQTCGGGLRWQIPYYNRGYDYKNSISNGCFLALGARLGAYTGNHSYFEWVDRTWDWMDRIGLISPQYQVFDGSDCSPALNCSQLDHVQWTYNGGVMLLGAATMWNQTTGPERAKWELRVSGLLRENLVFFKNGIMFEIACEPNNNCDTDQLSFKAYMSRWMASTTKLAPWTSEQITPLLTSSARAAALQCSGGSDGVTCGAKWTQNSTWDGTWGVGQQMSALEVVQAHLIGRVQGPLGNGTGGISEGNPGAGTESGSADGEIPVEISTGEKAGAAVLTAAVVLVLLGGSWWLVVD